MATPYILVDIFWHHIMYRICRLQEQQPGHDASTVEPDTNYTDKQPIMMIAGKLVNIFYYYFT